MSADPVLRLRQICLLARDLEWTTRVLTTIFDAPVVFRDPRMAAGGTLPTPTFAWVIRFSRPFVQAIWPGGIRRPKRGF